MSSPSGADEFYNMASEQMKNLKPEDIDKMLEEIDNMNPIQKAGLKAMGMDPGRFLFYYCDGDCDSKNIPTGWFDTFRWQTHDVVRKAVDKKEEIGDPNIFFVFAKTL